MKRFFLTLLFIKVVVSLALMLFVYDVDVVDKAHRVYAAVTSDTAAENATARVAATGGNNAVAVEERVAALQAAVRRIEAERVRAENEVRRMLVSGRESDATAAALAVVDADQRLHQFRRELHDAEYHWSRLRAADRRGLDLEMSPPNSPLDALERQMDAEQRQEAADVLIQGMRQAVDWQAALEQVRRKTDEAQAEARRHQAARQQAEAQVAHLRAERDAAVGAAEGHRDARVQAEVEAARSRSALDTAERARRQAGQANTELQAGVERMQARQGELQQQLTAARRSTASEDLAQLALSRERLHRARAEREAAALKERVACLEAVAESYANVMEVLNTNDTFSVQNDDGLVLRTYTLVRPQRPVAQRRSRLPVAYTTSGPVYEYWVCE